jgi:hypothetical protein
MNAHEGAQRIFCDLCLVKNRIQRLIFVHPGALGGLVVNCILEIELPCIFLIIFLVVSPVAFRASFDYLHQN